MFQQLQLNFVLVLYMRLFLESHAVSDICSICDCQFFLTNIDCSSRGLAAVPKPIPPNVQSLDLRSNDIKEIKEDTFRNLSSLTELYLQYNDINKIEMGSFEDLFSLRTLNLRSNDIKEIKEDTFRNLYSLSSLHLQENDINEIAVGSFQNLSSLRNLDLRSNNIKVIKEGTFRNLSSLTFLYLQYNEIYETEVGSFQNLSSLRNLDLRSNDIKEIKENTFQNLPSLTSLYLQYNDIKEIGVGSFQNLSSLNTLNLGSNDIKEIKAGIFLHLPSLTSLYLSSNDIIEINEDAFQHLSSLRTLYLSSNDIKEIKGGTFRNLSSLTTLYLQYNDINEIAVESFQSLSSLRTIDLSHNNITEIKEDTFRNLSSLRSLDLGSNNIKEIKDDTFRHLSTLTSLDLEHNNITGINVSTFKNLHSLTSLNLWDNDIKEIEVGAFKNLSKLSELDLADNNIKEIKAETFQNLRSLRRLLLGDNDIKEIKVETFRNLSRLTTLYLNKNNIVKIQVGTFYFLPSLRYLSLQSNEIKEIKTGTFQNLFSLRNLNLGENNIKEIKGEAFQNLSSLASLNLGGNDLKEIKAELFQYLSGLTTLNLGRNDLKEIKAELFQNLSGLTSLYLNKINIEKIPVGTFDNLPRLDYLNLGGNNIKEIKGEIFQNLSRLTSLDLGGNDLKELKAELFQYLSGLRTLYLNENNIEKIQLGTFDVLPKLIYLDLSGNNIKEITGEIFQNLSSLSILDLGGNDLKEIKPEIFQYLSGLTNLYLHKNNIKFIQRGVLEYLRNLERLHLNENNIEIIQVGTFNYLPRLSYLDLSNNRIKNYEDGSFLFLPRINYIDLRNNTEMKCGCYLLALANYMKSMYSRTLDVKGECQIDSGNNQNKVIPIMEYSHCKNYSLFQRNLQCQLCSGMICNNSHEIKCEGDEPVCRMKLSMNGIKPKFEKSCSTNRECADAMRSNTFPCSKWTSDSSCVACCIGNLCNRNDFIGWSNSFVFHLIFNSTLKKFNEYKSFHENISRAVYHELSNLKVAFEVQYCGFEEDSEVFTLTCSVPRKITKDLALKQILETLRTSQTLRDLGFQQRNMKLIDEMVCNENITTTSNDALYWPMTKIGTNATIPCHANVATRYCSAKPADVTSPKCSPFTGIWQEPDMTQCYNTQRITLLLKNITNEDIDKENVEKVSTILRDISKKSVYFKEQDIDLAVNIHEKMVPLISNVSANITVNNILLSINDIINTPEEVLIKAEQSEKIGNRMLKIIEAIPDKIPLEEQQISIVYSNLGIGVIKVDADTFNGAFYGVSYGNNENETKTMVYNNSDSNPQVDDTTDSISLPNNLFKHLKEEDRSAVSRISFIAMQDDKLYRVIRNSGPEERSKIISKIIAANVPNISVTNLEEPINISFHLKEQNAANLQCVYWDESPGQSPDWSPRGCNMSKDGPGGRVICSCEHLTSFAVLKKIDLKICSSISPNTSCIGCAISLACLILTVIIHICFKKLRKSMSSKILINLCISLAITNLILLIGIQPYASRTIATCKAVAALFHYFLLTNVMWMAIEALHIFLSVTTVFQTYQTSFMLKSSILAWGLPAVIVAITLAINYTNNYIRIGPIQLSCYQVGAPPLVEQIASGIYSFCWLSKIPFYAAFLAPVAIILLFNCTMICLAIRRLISVKYDKLYERKIKLRIGGIFSLISLFVLCCVLAFFVVEEGDREFPLLFTIFNALLGIFIFIFYCICTKDIKDAICFRLCRRKKWNAKQSCENK